MHHLSGALGAMAEFAFAVEASVGGAERGHGRIHGKR
jgi:hypothetical protein